MLNYAHPFNALPRRLSIEGILQIGHIEGLCLSLNHEHLYPEGSDRNRQLFQLSLLPAQGDPGLIALISGATHI